MSYRKIDPKERYDDTLMEAKRGVVAFLVFACIFGYVLL